MRELPTHMWFASRGIVVAIRNLQVGFCNWGLLGFALPQSFQKSRIKEYAVNHKDVWKIWAPQYRPKSPLIHCLSRPQAGGAGRPPGSAGFVPLEGTSV